MYQNDLTSGTGFLTTRLPKPFSFFMWACWPSFRAENHHQKVHTCLRWGEGRKGENAAGWLVSKKYWLLSNSQFRTRYAFRDRWWYHRTQHYISLQCPEATGGTSFRMTIPNSGMRRYSVKRNITNNILLITCQALVTNVGYKWSTYRRRGLFHFAQIFDARCAVKRTIWINDWNELRLCDV